MRSIKTEVNWLHLSKYAPMDDVRMHPCYPWYRKGLSHNKALTVRDIEELDMPNAVGIWDWYTISRRISMDEVRAHPDRPWDRDGLSMNKGLRVSDIDGLSMPNAVSVWRWHHISRHVPMEDVRAHPDKPWNKQYLSMNRSITLEDILHMNMPNATDEWDWYHLSIHIDVDEIAKHPGKGWHGDALEYNGSFDVRKEDHRRVINRYMLFCHRLSYCTSLDVIKDTADREFWSKKLLSLRKDLTVHDILHSSLSKVHGTWDWMELSKRIPMEEVRAHPKLPWCKEGLRENKTLCIGDIDLL